SVTRSGPTTAPMITPYPFRISHTASAISIAENRLSFIAAVTLFIGGILVLRDSRKGPRYHWMYIWMKIPLVILAAIASFLTYQSMMSGMSTMPGTPPPPAFSKTIGAVSATMTAGIALAYPVALIFLLNSRQVKQHYQ